MDNPTSLMERYNLTEEDCNKQVSNSHLEEISRSLCKHWISLPSHLEMQSFVLGDSDYEGEEEKRLWKYNFFLVWKQKKGSGATYAKLISALLEIESTNDAERLCKLLQESSSSLSLSISIPLSPTTKSMITLREAGKLLKKLSSPPPPPSTKSLRKDGKGMYAVAVFFKNFFKFTMHAYTKVMYFSAYPDLKALCTELDSVKHKLPQIGALLGIPNDKLEEFKKEGDPLSAALVLFPGNLL